MSGVNLITTEERLVGLVSACDEVNLEGSSRSAPRGRQLIALGSLPVLEGETLEACLERYRASARREASD